MEEGGGDAASPVQLRNRLHSAWSAKFQRRDLRVVTPLLTARLTCSLPLGQTRGSRAQYPEAGTSQRWGPECKSSRQREEHSWQARPGPLHGWRGWLRSPALLPQPALGSFAPALAAAFFRKGCSDVKSQVRMMRV